MRVMSGDFSSCEWLPCPALRGLGFPWDVLVSILGPMHEVLSQKMMKSSSDDNVLPGEMLERPL